GPVHVAVAHQDELRVDSLRKECFCECFVEFWHPVPSLGSLPMPLLRPVQLRFGTSRWWLRETLHQACAQVKGGIIFFSCRAGVRSWHEPAGESALRGYFRPQLPRRCLKGLHCSLNSDRKRHPVFLLRTYGAIDDHARRAISSISKRTT